MSSGLTFYPKSHRYKLDGQWVPGVTTILGVLDKPAIPKWAAKTVAEFVYDHPNTIETLRPMGRDATVNALKEIPWKQRDDAADRGTNIHDIADRLLQGEEVPVDDDLAPIAESALQFLADWQIRPTLIEVPVASRQHQYAGTADLFAEYVHPVTGHQGLAIFDWKSGKRLYPEYAWQLAAYAHADFASSQNTEQPIPPCDAAFGVHIRADGYDVAPFAFGPDIFQEFVTIRQCYTIVKEGRGDWRKPGTGHLGLTIQP